MATQSGDNGLYFIVGGLVVLAVIFGLLFYNNGLPGMSPEPDSIIERTTNNTIVEREGEPASASAEVEVDESGASAATTSNP